MLVNIGINEFRDAIEVVLSAGELGSDGTEVTEADTDTGAVISGTNKTLTTTKFNKGIKTTYESSAGDGSGSTAREYVMKNSGGDIQARATFPEIDIGPTTQFNIDSKYLFVQQL